MKNTLGYSLIKASDLEKNSKVIVLESEKIPKSNRLFEIKIK